MSDKRIEEDGEEDWLWKGMEEAAEQGRMKIVDNVAPTINTCLFCIC